ncbi:Pre-rRNA-processing protein ipi3 [Coemansia javaensis]|uniref:Pre-rRNA-processing protein ipi3 n=1 Tax=Coemansia javaensis TaxID=2761396 RepID=A0A9W8HGS4_9FUNG|nr:Pre-rRNA-processing protein ipi3 [Coemansia javaensis]
MFVETLSIGTRQGIQVYDLRRGTRLAQCVNAGVGGRQGFAQSDGWIAAASDKKAMCHVYAVGRGDGDAKLGFPFPEEVACVHAVEGGRYLAAGARSGRILVWAVGSGQMVGSWDAHYGAVTALASCAGALVSGGEDAAVHVWALAQVLDRAGGRDAAAAAAPIATVAEHTMAITALHISQAGLLGGRGRLYTASRDHTCKQWQVRAGRGAGSARLLATLVYPGAVADVAVDGGETRVFAATAAGLFQTDLYAAGARGLAAVGGTGDAVVCEGHVQYPAAEAAAGAVCLSLDGTLLASAAGGAGGVVRVWDTASRQCLRTIGDKQLAAGVTQLEARLAPPQLGGPRAHASAGLQRAGGARGPAPALAFAPLQRLPPPALGAGGEEAAPFDAAVKAALPGAREDMARFDAALAGDAPYAETARGDVLLPGGTDANTSSGAPPGAQTDDLLRQLDRLQRHNARTRRLNDELYQGAVTEWLSSWQKRCS